MRAWAAAFLALMAAGCGAGGPVVEPVDDTLLRETFNDVSRGDFGAVEARLDPSLRTSQTRPALAQVQRAIHAAGAPCARSLIVATTFREMNIRGGGQQRRLVAQHQYACPNAVLVVETNVTVPTGERPIVTRFYVTPIDPAAAAAAQRFDFAGKTWRHYAFAGLTVLCPLLMVIAFFGALLTRGLRWWSLLAFVGLCRFFMVWPTGAISANWVSINLLGATAMRGVHPLSQWTLAFTLPIGALIVLSLLLPRWARLSGEPRPEPPPPAWPPN